MIKIPGGDPKILFAVFGALVGYFIGGTSGAFFGAIIGFIIELGRWR